MSALALIAAAVLVVPRLSISPAAAACSPTLNPGDTLQTVNCTGNDTAGVGDGSQGQISVNVLPQATVTVSGSNAINLFDGNTITNNGAIAVDSNAAIGVHSGNVIINNGTLTAPDNSFGVNAANANKVTNNGAIAVGGNGAAGILVAGDTATPGSANTVVNNGSITAGDNAAFGITGVDSNTITNAGSIAVGNGGSYGIDMTGDGTNGADRATVTNSGTIIAGSQSFGIGVGNFYKIVNTGTISVGDAGTGIQANSVVDVKNSGTIAVTGLGFGVQLTGAGDTVTNSGAISAPGGAAIFGGGSAATVVNNGSMLGKVFLLNAANTLTNNGYLQGQFAVFGDVTNNGTIIGGDPNTITAQSGGSATGTLTNGPSGTLAVRVSPTLNDTYLGGAINLNGRLQIVVTPGLYGTKTTYSSASPTASAPVGVCGCGPGTVNGAFASVVSTSPFFAATADYSHAGEVDVILTRYGLGATPGSTPNQRSVGGALETGYSPSLDPSSIAGQFYANLLASPSLTVLDHLSGQGTAAMQNASIAGAALFNEAMQGQGLNGDLSGGTSVVIPSQYAATPRPRGQEAFASVGPADTSASAPGRWRVWTLGFGATRSLDGSATLGTANQTMHNYGGAIGVDRLVKSDLLLGASVGGSTANIAVPTLATSGQITAGHVGVYGVKSWGPLYGAASVSYARLDNSTARTITGIGASETATGRFDSDQLSARFELGWKQAFAQMTVTPFVAMEPAALWAHGYAETSTTAGGGSGVLGLSFTRHTTTSLPSFVGVQFDRRTVLGNGEVVSPYARVSWVHEFLTERSITAAFINIPASTFSVDGARAASDAARLDAGLNLQFDRTRSVFANLSSEWSGISTSYAATAGFRLVR